MTPDIPADAAQAAPVLGENVDDHEPVLGRFGNLTGVVGCACMTTREWFGYLHAHGGPGWKAWAEHLTGRAVIADRLAARLGQQDDQQAADDLSAIAVEVEKASPSRPMNGDGSRYMAAKVLAILDRHAGTDAPSTAAREWRAQEEARVQERIAELAAAREPRSESHEPLEVTSVDGWPMVKCSCDGDNPRNIRWQSAHWLRYHWRGTQDEGVAALNAVVAKQAAEATR